MSHYFFALLHLHCKFKIMNYEFDRVGDGEVRSGRWAGCGRGIYLSKKVGIPAYMIISTVLREWPPSHWV